MKDLKRGSTINVEVTRQVIDSSEPCEKKSCMVTVAATEALTAAFGRRNYYVSTTSGGVNFTMDGRRYDAVFPQSTAKKIVTFDRTFRTTKSVDEARRAVRPFATQLTVLKSVKIPPKPTPEQKEWSNKKRNERRAEDRAGGVKRVKFKGGTGRQISM